MLLGRLEQIGTTSFDALQELSFQRSNINAYFCESISRRVRHVLRFHLSELSETEFLVPYSCLFSLKSFSIFVGFTDY